MVTFTHIGWVADRFGRKFSFYIAWLWLIVVCGLQDTIVVEATDVLGLHAA